MTTTGFVTVHYLLWPPVLIMLIFALFFFGASIGSTGGGVKIMRIGVLLKNSYYELQRLIHPHAVIPVRFNRFRWNQNLSITSWHSLCSTLGYSLLAASS
jgi:trk system potassium uptake protein TrkH